MSTIDNLRNPAFSSFLDLARWVAAWIVFVGHLRNPLFYGFGEIGIAAHNPLIIGWYFVTGWFGEAVIVFFVLSGFLIGGIGMAKYATNSFNSAHYAIDRYSRLYVAFFPALLLTLALDRIGMEHFGAAGLYDGTQAMFAEKLSPPFAIDNATLTEFLGNSFMLQTFRFETFGSNSPLWTISAEFWFYVAFGLALAILIKSKSLPVRAGLMLVGAIGLVALLTPLFVYYLGLWLIGLLVALIPSDRFRWPIPFAALLLILLVMFRIRGDQIMALEYGQAFRDYSVAIIFALLLHAMRETSSTLLVRSARINKWIADFSFSLYLIHFPVMLFVLSALYATGQFPGIQTGYDPTAPIGLGIYAGIIIFTALAAWLFSQATEKQTGKIRSALKRRFAA